MHTYFIYLLIGFTTLFGCSAEDGESISGAGNSAIPGPSDSINSSFYGTLLISDTFISTVNTVAAIQLLNPSISGEEGDSFTASESDYCLEDSDLPKALEGETKGISGFQADELDISSPSYSSRHFFCSLQNLKNGDGIRGSLNDARQILCLLNSLEDNPLKSDSFSTEESTISFVFSSECFATEYIAAARVAIGSLQGEFKILRSEGSDGWDETLKIRSFNWLDAKTEWDLKIKHSENGLISDLVFLNNIGERTDSSEYLRVKLDREGKLFVERKSSIIRQSDITGTLEAFNSSNPVNRHSIFYLDANLEKDLYKVASINDLKSVWTRSEVYEEGSVKKFRSVLNAISGSSNAGFSTNNYSCFENGSDRTCADMTKTENYTLVENCTPTDASCSDAAATVDEGSLSRFLMLNFENEGGVENPDDNYKDAGSEDETPDISFQ